MLFVNWWLVGEATLALLKIASGVIGFAKAGKLSGKWAIWNPCPVLPVAAVGTLPGLLLMLTTVSGCESASEPIYSLSGQVTGVHTVSMKPPGLAR